MTRKRIQMQKTREQRKVRVTVKRRDRNRDEGERVGQTNKQNRSENIGWRGGWVRQREICGHSGDDRCCSDVGVDPFITLPTKADTGANTQGTERGLCDPICVCLCVCTSSVIKGPWQPWHSARIGCEQWQCYINGWPSDWKVERFH